ncbi:flavin reductase [Variovorax sp. LG9.2]|uniref:flavin reductase n=1 Tax=Variovorax sp. LG9.2 TaxID=3048626 RepID=UPI002B225D03|nr:flavin reductase [Variovorax sp. LG9.2]MEB0060117.1 flavin reductase [Variovorax sp. LG9.2]
MSDTPTFDKRQLRDVLGTFVTGVTIVTTHDGDGKVHGVTANSFSSVSLDPPLVLWSQSLTSKSHPAFRDSDHFVVNILADDQIELSNRFAKSSDDKFSGVEHSAGLGGAPVLHGAAAHLECVKVASYPGGDHVVYIGRVERFRRFNGRPLAFGSGRYMVASSHDLGPATLGVGNWKPTPVDAIDHVSQAMPAICESVGQHTMCLAVWGNRGPTAIRWLPSAQPVSANLRTGLVMNVTQSATGKAFAAFLPPEVTKAFVEEELRLFASADADEPTRRQRFEEEMAEVRKHGIARSVGANASPLHQVPVNAFSAPVFDAEGHMILALSLTTPASRMSPDWDGAGPGALAAAAARLSTDLGHQQYGSKA